MNILTEEEERELASEVIKMCPELSGIGRTADQYVRDPRTVQALKTRNTKLREALNAIVACKGQTLLGCAPDNEYSPGSRPDEERAHEYGAYKAFNQCADIALAAVQGEDDG